MHFEQLAHQRIPTAVRGERLPGGDLLFAVMRRQAIELHAERARVGDKVPVFVN